MSHDDEVAEMLGFLHLPGQVQMLMAVYVKDKGWITTRRGIIYGGHHGEPPMIDQPEQGEKMVADEARSGFRALAYRYNEEAATDA